MQNVREAVTSKQVPVLAKMEEKGSDLLSHLNSPKQNKKQKIQMKTKQTTQIIAETMFFKTLEVAVKTLDITMKDSDP